jgi:hypothetical protein
MATISNTPRPGYVWDSTDNVWYPIGTGPHTHADYITSGSAINPNIVDAKGDIIAATAADTVARLVVGANDTVLTADSSTATGLKWAAPAAGGMTLISTTTLTGASITLSSIPATYNYLKLIVRNYKPASNGAILRMRFNGDSGANRYYSRDGFGTATTNSFDSTQFNVGSGNNNTLGNGLTVIDIADYTNAVTYKMANAFSMGNDSSTAIDVNLSYRTGSYNQTGAISSITLFPSTGNFTSGEVLLYGVK